MQTTTNPYHLTLRAAGGTLLLLLCAACSKTPSSGEIDEAVAGMLGSQCKAAHVENTRLINGTAIGERQYVAKVGFDIVISPDPKAQALWSEYRAVQVKADEREALYSAQYKELDGTLSESLQATHKRLEVAIDQAEKARDDSHHKLREEYLAQKQDKEARLSELSSKNAEDQRAIKDGFQGHEELKAIITASGCTSWTLNGIARDLVSQALAANSEPKYEVPRAYYKTFGEGAKQSFTLEINLIKTDNGWKTGL